MVEFKLVISDPKTGKTVQRVLSEEQSDALIGMSIGDNFKGDLVGLAGYEFVITGGSDYCGFPMRKDVPGTLRKKIYAVGGVGINKTKGKGIRTRKRVAPATIHAKTAQVNVKIVKKGKEDLFAEPKEESSGEAAEQSSEAQEGEAGKAEQES
ncbi:30S ribosomal protein S6e [Candidatus Woesearchaeota archaeon]|nr:MAG: 30S ribosomal protein S6e [Candidatus Woesearchaeota archaeon]